jgi:succinate dehydrogenase / fumarate reductase, membrane anchor subunit
MANVGSKRLVVGAHYGLKDWIAQRVTAVIMAVYSLILLVGILFSNPLDYVAWVKLFTWSIVGLPVGKLLAFVAILSLLYHAWIGMRDLWMDYIKPTGVRLTLEVLTILWLVGSAAYAAQILWRV